MLMPPAGSRGSKAVVLVELPAGRDVTPERAVVWAVPVALWLLPELAGVVGEAESLVEAGSEPLAVAEGDDVSVAEVLAEFAPGHIGQNPLSARILGPRTA